MGQLGFTQTHPIHTLKVLMGWVGFVMGGFGWIT
jgi:hypothetical protein